METDLFNPIKSAVNFARTKKTWVVILAPMSILVPVRHILIGIVDGECQGRTAMLKGGGKVSVITAETNLKVDGEYHLLKAGWGRATKEEEKSSKVWEDKAAQVLNFYQYDFDPKSVLS